MVRVPLPRRSHGFGAEMPLKDGAKDRLARLTNNDTGRHDDEAGTVCTRKVRGVQI